VQANMWSHVDPMLTKQHLVLRVAH
jgi:hypothetical protein